MVVHGLRDEGRAGHEAERGVEILKRERSADGIAALHQVPSRQTCRNGFAGGLVKLLCHVSLLSSLRQVRLPRKCSAVQFLALTGSGQSDLAAGISRLWADGQ